MNKRYVLKNRRRFYIFVIMVTIVISFSALAAAVNGADTGDEYISVIVESGDTLWDLAREYKSSGDLRQYIREVEKINNLTDSLIYEGDILKMPV
jgi:nucleoid-associated protein YgaU